MYLLPLILLIIGVMVYEYKTQQLWFAAIAGIVGAALIVLITVAIDYKIQIVDIETWSGRITQVYHKEEWNEWHKPRTWTETETYYVNGKSKTRTVTKHRAGYWEHHYAENKITTSDGGEIVVEQAPTGKRFDDSWVNSTQELEQFWKVGEQSASLHSYDNYVQASYSIYRHKDINLKEYPGLPEYPKTVRSYSHVDRFLGNIPNGEAVNDRLGEWNAELNKFIPDPENPGKKRSWKQVNLIFVNLGDVTDDYGFALQDHWENGNKNDFVVAFATDSSYRVKWVYPFSWADNQSSELLKIKTREYVANLGQVNDWIPVVDHVGQLVADNFERKEMAEFNYLKIPVSTAATIIIWILLMLGMGAYVGVRHALTM